MDALRCRAEAGLPRAFSLAEEFRGIAGHAMQHLLKKLSRIRHHQIEPLTTRERQIARIMAEGLTNKEIAQRLRLTEGTGKVHLHRIYRKLGIANRTALAILAHTNFAKHLH